MPKELAERATTGLTTYLLRGVPQGVWRRVKCRAVDEGRSIREVIIRALEAYLRS